MADFPARPSPCDSCPWRKPVPRDELAEHVAAMNAAGRAHTCHETWQQGEDAVRLCFGFHRQARRAGLQPLRADREQAGGLTP